MTLYSSFLRNRWQTSGPRSSVTLGNRVRSGRGFSSSGSSVASSGGRLDALQIRVLDALADVDPRFVLSGGGALAGVYLGHRTTRDLDLFWRNREELGTLPNLAEQRLAQDGLSVTRLQTAPAFVQLQVSDGDSVV